VGSGYLISVLVTIIVIAVVRVSGKLQKLSTDVLRQKAREIAFLGAMGW
jgi:hypothetical protein